MKTKIGVLGSKGRMGEWVTRLLAAEFPDKATLHATADRGEPFDGFLSCDAVIDFSSPAAALSLVGTALRNTGEQLPAFVIGSTGWKLDERRVLEQLAAKTPVLISSNFSTGVLGLLELLKQAAPLFERLGYTPVIVETHHKHKKDAPSGTALSLQRAISPAGPGNIQTHSVRAGEVIGDHEVTFYGPGDSVSLRHHAQDRSIFARGAIETAIWLSKSRAGHPEGKLLSMDDYFRGLLNA